MTLALKSSSIMDKAFVPLSTIFVEVSLEFQKGCRAHHNHYLQSSSLILDGPRMLFLLGLLLLQRRALVKRLSTPRPLGLK